MRAKKAIAVTVAVSFAGLVAIALSGCEWFSFTRNKTTASDTLGYEKDTAAWLTSNMDSNRYDAFQSYQSAKAAGEIGSDVTFLDYLKATGDSSAALTAGLRSSVALAVAYDRADASLGSGVIYSLESNADGGATAYVITNYHVVYNNKESGSDKFGKRYYAYLYGDKYDTTNLASESALTATYVGGAMQEDIAVLSVEIPQERVSYVQSVCDGVGNRDSDRVNVGERVYAVGNLLGGGISVVSGVVSVEAEYNSFAKFDEPSESMDIYTMRIDAPVNHGNSGGGLFDSNGRFLGIVNGGREITVKTNDNKDETVAVGGYGFAIPANRAISVAQNVIDNAEKNERAAYCGILGTLVTESSVGEFNSNTQSIDIVEKVVITGVSAGSPFGQDVVGKAIKAAKVTNASGLETVNQTILRRHQVETLLFNLRAGDTLTLTFEDGSVADGVYNNNFLKIN